MVELILVRHAKSDWGDPGVDDHDRPLNARGQRDAPNMARMLSDAGVVLDRVLSSTATRAHSTAVEFGNAFDLEVEFETELYHASASTLMAHAAASEVDSVMIVAHNPGISALAEQLSGGEITHMPTCSIAQFTWDADDWASVEWDQGMSWSFETPD